MWDGRRGEGPYWKQKCIGSSVRVICCSSGLHTLAWLKLLVSQLKLTFKLRAYIFKYQALLPYVHLAFTHMMIGLPRFHCSSAPCITVNANGRWNGRPGNSVLLHVLGAAPIKALFNHCVIFSVPIRSAFRHWNYFWGAPTLLKMRCYINT